MTLTISYKNGEFTCTFTPDGDASIQVNGAGAVTANSHDTGLGYQEMNPDNEDPAAVVEMTISDQGEFSTEIEEDQSEIEFEGSTAVPATKSQREVSVQKNGTRAVKKNMDNVELWDRVMDRGNEDTAEDVEMTTSDQEEFPTEAEEGPVEIESNDYSAVPASRPRSVEQPAIYLGNYPRIKDRTV